MAYSPRYLSVDDVPLTGPDEWSNDEKLARIEDAEAQLEADVNDGTPIPDSERERIHGLAVNAYATYLLATGPKAPDSMLAGDFQDEGSEREGYAEHLLRTYKRTKNSILAADEDSSDKDSSFFMST